MFTLYGVYYYHFLWTETQRYGQRYGHGHGYGCGHVGGVGYEHGAQVGVNDKIYLRPTLVLTFDGFFMVSVRESLRPGIWLSFFMLNCLFSEFSICLVSCIIQNYAETREANNYTPSKLTLFSRHWNRFCILRGNIFSAFARSNWYLASICLFCSSGSTGCRGCMYGKWL